MEILFSFPETEAAFRKREGAASLLQSLEASGYSWSYLDSENLLQREKTDPECWKSRELQKSILVTEQHSAALAWKERKLCCIGYQEPGDSSFFYGAAAVITSLEALEPEYLLRIHHHFYGIPVEIGITKRLVVRESIPEDFEALYAIAREEGNDRYTETMCADREAAREIFQAYLRNVYSFYGFGLWTIIERQSGRILGRCGFSVIEDEDGMDGAVSMGYLIGQKDRKKGYAKEACKAALEYLHRIEAPETVWAVIHKDNIPSLHVAGYLGFRCERKKDEEYLLYRYGKE